MSSFAGQDLLDRFAQFLPEMERFRGVNGLGLEALRVEPEPAGAALTSQGPAATDGFDAMPPATENPAVQQVIAQAEAKRAKAAPVTSGAGKGPRVRGDATAFWSQARALRVDRVKALAIIAASAGDWAAALQALGEL